MTCKAELLLEWASESMASEYFFGLSSLSALSEARVIIGSCLGCSCSFSRVDAEVEEAAERALALLQVMMPKVAPFVTRTLLFFALVTRTT
ncbi:hypothetical protein ACFX13_041431 [Malus domestica]